MTDNVDLHSLLSGPGRTAEQKLALFAWLNLGILESLSGGLMTATDAVRIFFNARNCLFVRQQLQNPIADEIMSRGVQLPDLFEILPMEEAQREFQHELSRSGEAGPDSDVDILVDVGREHSPFFPGGLIADLQDLLGCEVEVLTPDALHWYIRDRVLQEAVMLRGTGE